MAVRPLVDLGLKSALAVLQTWGAPIPFSLIFVILLAFSLPLSTLWQEVCIWFRHKEVRVSQFKSHWDDVIKLKWEVNICQSVVADEEAKNIVDAKWECPLQADGPYFFYSWMQTYDFRTFEDRCEFITLGFSLHVTCLCLIFTQ